MKYDSLIFDLDGTLWDSTEGIVKTWAQVLEHHPEVKRGPVTAGELAANFGLPIDRIAANMFPELSAQERNSLMDECCARENDYLAEHGGALFAGETEVLEKLSSLVPLYIVSNCQEGYIQSFYKGNNTARYFSDCECSGATGLSKGKNISLVIGRNALRSPAFAGDTQGDADAAREAGIPFIFARYGFGEAGWYDEVIDSLQELPAILLKE